MKDKNKMMTNIIKHGKDDTSLIFVGVLGEGGKGGWVGGEEALY